MKKPPPSRAPAPAPANAGSRSRAPARRRRQRLAALAASAVLSLGLPARAQEAPAEEGDGGAERTTPPADGTWDDPPVEPQPLPPPRSAPPRVVYYGPPPPEAAPPPERRPPPPPEPPEHRLEIALGGAMFPAALGAARFVGEGVPLGMERRTTFSRTGRELGLRNPTFWGGELAIGYRHTYFGVTLSGVMATNTRADAAPTNYAAATQVGTGSVKAYGGGIELFGALPLGRLTLSAGAIAGLRAFSVPMTGFEPTTCTSSGRGARRRYPCPEDAVTPVAPYLQPRVHVDVSLDAAQTFFLGAYGGVDALGDRSFLGGVTIGFRLPKIDP